MKIGLVLSALAGVAVSLQSGNQNPISWLSSSENIEAEAAAQRAGNASPIYVKAEPHALSEEERASRKRLVPFYARLYGYIDSLIKSNSALSKIKWSSEVPVKFSKELESQLKDMPKAKVLAGIDAHDAWLEDAKRGNLVNKENEEALIDKISRQLTAMRKIAYSLND